MFVLSFRWCHCFSGNANKNSVVNGFARIRSICLEMYLLLHATAPWPFMAVALQQCPWAPGRTVASCAAQSPCSLLSLLPALCLSLCFSPSLVFVLLCSHLLPSVSPTPACSSFPPLCAALRLCVCSCCAVPKVLMFPAVKLPTSGWVTAAGSPSFTWLDWSPGGKLTNLYSPVIASLRSSSIGRARRS